MKRRSFHLDGHIFADLPIPGSRDWLQSTRYLPEVLKLRVCMREVDGEWSEDNHVTIDAVHPQWRRLL